MTTRQLLAQPQDTSAARRAKAAEALVRITLKAHLTPETAERAWATILSLLDDPAPLVRQALAEACAASPAAPRALVVALAGDRPDIAAHVLKHSPVLTDADLVDGIAIGCEITRRAIAERRTLSHAVAGAMAEIAGPSALTALAGNHRAAITTGSLLRLVARHGDAAPLREALLARPGLPLEVRQACTDRMTEAMARLAVDSGWLTAARGERAGRETRERATLSFSVGAPPLDLARFIAYLRTNGRLNAGLILRAILSGHMAFAETALADLAGLPPARVAGLMHEGARAAYAALHRKAGLPLPLLPAFAAALSAWREAGRGESGAHGAALSRLMIERALTACETMPFAEAQGVMALLARFEAEAARDEARERGQAAAERAAPVSPAAADLPDAVSLPVRTAEPETSEIETRDTGPRAAAPADRAHEAPVELIAYHAPARIADEPAPFVGEGADTPEDVPGRDADFRIEEAAPLESMDLIFEALPFAMLARFQEDREAKVLHDHEAKREADRERDVRDATLRQTELRDADVWPEAERPHGAAVTDDRSTIPNDLVASYRADRVRLAA